jgi:sigma-B regulation protein RsbU (phosphoserine phosphatase)
MADVTTMMLRGQLVERRDRLTRVAGALDAGEVGRLLGEVDAALQRIEEGRFGLCETCGDPIETDRLLANPIERYCLDHLTPREMDALRRDLALATQVQQGLLPRPGIVANGWQIAYRYEPAASVSGDYCDVMAHGDALYFLVGDVSGKGVSASLLMAHLHAMFRSLIPMGLPLEQLVGRASRMFCESTLPTHYATLVCGRALPSGDTEVCSAGHPPVVRIAQGRGERLPLSGVPLGMFSDVDYAVQRLHVAENETLLIYTDGAFEAEDAGGNEFGIDRLLDVAARSAGASPDALLDACLADVAAFRAGPPHDDVTLMTVHRLRGRV